MAVRIVPCNTRAKMIAHAEVGDVQGHAARGTDGRQGLVVEEVRGRSSQAGQGHHARRPGLPASAA